ncbi:MAG TPA: hypothetical protein V6C95_17225 [Coleofasciculaceae cyanobacterium]
MNNQHNHTTPNSNSPEPNNRPLNNHVQVVAPEPTSYKDGYVHGRVTERRIDNQRRHILAENTAARALLLGITLTSLLGLAIGSVFLLNHREQEQEVTPVLVPSPTATQTPTTNTTIIERTQVVPANPEPATPSNSGQLLVPTQPSPTSQPQPSQSQNPTTSTNPTTIQRNSEPQPSPQPSQNPTSDRTTTPTQPYISNPASSGQNQTSTTTGTSGRATQPYTTNQTSPSPTQNSNPAGTSTTTPSDTTNQTSPDTTQNPTQSNNSDSAR